ncbi:MAG: hypothetical protein IKA17_04110 [Clostridia bacterium]|nr:hypothetical protein [Clostridia bacterium]
MQEVFQNEKINHIHHINRISFNKFFSVSAAEVTRESAPCNATNEAITVVESFIGDILTEVQNGLGYAGKITYVKAEFDARVKIYQSVNPSFNPNVEYMKDPLSRDIPSVDNSLFILARKLILS